MSALSPFFSQRVRAWFRPPRTLTITRAGRTFLLLSLGIGLGALNTGNNLLYLVLGLMLSVVVVSGVLSERALGGLSVRRLGAEDAFAGEPFPFRWAITSRRGPSFALLIAEDEAALEGQGTIAFLPPGDERVVRANLVASRRGPVVLSAIKVTTSYPFGLFAKTRRFETPGELLVYPRRGFGCADPERLDNGPAGEVGNPRRRDGDGDLLGLRPLRVGEDARRIHWKKSAAAGQLLRIEREREERRSYVLKIDALLSADELERRCEEAAAITERLLQRGHEVGLSAGGMQLRPSSGPAQQRRILRALAWAGFEEPAQ